jgi:hypothetical protein
VQLHAKRRAFSQPACKRSRRECLSNRRKGALRGTQCPGGLGWGGVGLGVGVDTGAVGVGTGGLGVGRGGCSGETVALGVGVGVCQGGVGLGEGWAATAGYGIATKLKKMLLTTATRKSCRMRGEVVILIGNCESRFF